MSAAPNRQLSKAKRKLANERRKLGLQVAAGFATLLAAMVGWTAFRSCSTNRQAIDAAIETWRRDYHLSDDQAARIRQIEQAYHGTGTIFTRPAHSLAEVADHAPSISRVMNQEEGARFLADQERIAQSKPGHTRTPAR